MKFCEECGEQIDDEAGVCPYCGTIIETDEEAVDEIVETEGAEDVQEEVPVVEPDQTVDEIADQNPVPAPMPATAQVETTAAPVQNETKQSNKKPIIIGICGGVGAGLIIMLVLIVTGVIKFGGSGDEKLADAVTGPAIQVVTESPSPSPSPTPEPTEKPTPKPTATPKPNYLKSGTYEGDAGETGWTIIVEKNSSKSATIQLIAQSYHRTNQTLAVPCDVKNNKAEYSSPFYINGVESESLYATIKFKKGRVICKIDGGDGFTINAKRTSGDVSFWDAPYGGGDGEGEGDDYEDYDDYDDEYY